MGVATIVFIILFGLALIAIGLRGRVVRHGPTCRRCKFDLSGLHLPLLRCPECGSELDKRQRVQRGLRRMRAVPIVAGALIVCGVAAYKIAGVPSFVTSPATQACLPTFVLVGETYLPESLARPALAELAARIQSDAVSQDTADRLVTRALTRQAESNTPWWFEWGDIVIAGRNAGWVSDIDWVRFFRQGFRIVFECPDKIYVGSPLPVRTTVRGERLGGNVAGPDCIMVRNRIRQDGKDVAGSGQGAPLTSGGTATSTEYFPVESDSAGAFVPDVAWYVRVEPRNGSDSVARGEWLVKLDRVIKVVASDEIIGTPLQSAELHEQCARAIHATVSQAALTTTDAMLNVRFRFDDLPICIAFDVYLRAAGDAGAYETYLGSVAQSRTGDTRSAWPAFLSKRVSSSDTPIGNVDVVLRPSAKAAAQQFDCATYLGQEVIMRDLPVATKGAVLER